MSRTILFSGMASLVILMGLVAVDQVNAYRGDSNEKGPHYSPERHEAMTQAFASGDYAAWKELMQGKGRVTQVVNEGNFTRFAEAHALAQAGDIEGAVAIRAELGLGLRNGQGQGHKEGGFGKAGRWNQ